MAGCRTADLGKATCMTTQTEPEQASDAPDDRSPFNQGLSTALRTALVGFESLLYGLVGLLLIAAAVFMLWGTADAIAHAISGGATPTEIAILVLDRILLTLIVAELAYTLRFVIQTHEIVAEPFLFIGLIATVRRILIVTAEFEQQTPGKQLNDLLRELGLLGLLTLALAAAIFLIRLSAAKKR